MGETSLCCSGKSSASAFDPCSRGGSISAIYGCIKASPSENRTRLNFRSLDGDSESICRSLWRLSGDNLFFSMLFNFASVFVSFLVDDLGRGSTLSTIRSGLSVADHLESKWCLRVTLYSNSSLKLQRSDANYCLKPLSMASFVSSIVLPTVVNPLSRTIWYCGETLFVSGLRTSITFPECIFEWPMYTPTRARDIHFPGLFESCRSLSRT